MPDEQGLPLGTVAALADALRQYHQGADLVTKADIAAAPQNLEQKLTIRGAAGLVAPGGFVAGLKVFG